MTWGALSVELADTGIHIIKNADMTQSERTWLNAWFVQTNFFLH